jgi:hypothetical protein
MGAASASDHRCRDVMPRVACLLLLFLPLRIIVYPSSSSTHIRIEILTTISLLLFVGLILSAEPGAAENFTSAMKVSCGVAKRNFLSLVCG